MSHVDPRASAAAAAYADVACKNREASANNSHLKNEQLNPVLFTTATGSPSPYFSLHNLKATLSTIRPTELTTEQTTHCTSRYIYPLACPELCSQIQVPASLSEKQAIWRESLVLS